MEQPELETTLTAHDNSLTERPIERFKNAIQLSSINGEIKNQILAELEPGRSENPTDGIETGYQIIEPQLAAAQINADEQKELALLAIFAARSQ